MLIFTTYQTLENVVLILATSPDSRKSSTNILDGTLAEYVPVVERSDGYKLSYTGTNIQVHMEVDSIGSIQTMYPFL